MSTYDEDRDALFERRRRMSGAAGRRHYPRTDERIRDDIAERLYRSAHIDASEVTIDVKDGVVTLEGTVPARRFKHEIENIAAEIPGVKEVENRVRVASAPSAAAIGSQRPLEGSARPAYGRIAPEYEAPGAQRGSARHDEWLVDESVEESFPASDPPSSSQPGSLAAEEAASRSS